MNNYFYIKLTNIANTVICLMLLWNFFSEFPEILGILSCFQKYPKN